MPTLPPRPLPPRRRRPTAAVADADAVVRTTARRLALPVVERVRWIGLSRVVAGSVTVLAVVAGGYWLVRPPSLPVEASLPYPSDGVHSPASTVTVASIAPSTTASPGITVHVAGAVRAPGVYTLRAGARVVDAVDAAGGLAIDADADRINLAALLSDGERVFIPRVGQDDPLPVSPTVPSGGTAPSGPLNLNVATAAELESLPGIGPTTAASIVAYRDLHGPFVSVDDLTNVTGIGPSKLEALRGLVTV